MIELVQGVKTAAVMAKVGLALTAARNGDPEAIAYLRQDGLFEALEAMSPGTGMMAREAVLHGANFLKALRGQNPNVIEGEYRVHQPYARILRYLKAETFGGHVIAGPPGQGKTSLAFKLADMWRQETGYHVEVINAYPDDIPPWAEPISMNTIVERCKIIALYLAQQESGHVFKDGEPVITQKDLDKFSGRIIVGDEASASFGSFGGVGKIKAREAAMFLLAHCRHVDSLVIWIAQLLKMMNADVLSSSVVMLKKPGGREQFTDKPDEPLVRYLWQEAGIAFEHLHEAPGWEQPEYHKEQAWTYVDCPDTGGGNPYRGLMPFTPWQARPEVIG